MKVVEFTLAPTSLVAFSSGSAAALSAQGIVVVPHKHRGAATGGLVPIHKGRSCATVAVNEDGQRITWLTLQPGGRVTLHRTTSATEDIVAEVEGAEAVFVVAQYAVVVDAHSNAHFFAIPANVVAGEQVDELLSPFTSLGLVAPPAHEDDYIGLAVSTLANNGQAAAALFCQADDGTLAVRSVQLNPASPATVAWTASAPMPGKGELPVAWAVSSDGAVVMVVPQHGLSPFAVDATGVLPVSNLARALKVPGASIAGVCSTAGHGFAFVYRHTNEVSVRCIGSPRADMATVVVTLEGLPTLRSTTPVRFALYRDDRSAAKPSDAFRAYIQAGLALHRLPLSNVPLVVNNKPSPAPKDVDADGDMVPPASSKHAFDSTAAQLLLLAQAGGPPTPTGAPSVDDVVKAMRAQRAISSGYVLHDTPTVWSNDPKETAALVIDALVAEAAQGDVAAVQFFFQQACDLTATSLVRVLAAIAEASLRKDGMKAKAGRKDRADGSGMEWAMKETASLLEASTPKLQGSVHRAWRDARQCTDTRKVTNDAVMPVYRAVQCVLVHALATGRLNVFKCALAMLDAVVVQDSALLMRTDADLVQRTTQLVASVGSWASSEPGIRLGQLTGNSGVECTLTKEAQIAPLRAHRIRTAPTVRVVHETQTV